MKIERLVFFLAAVMTVASSRAQTAVVPPATSPATSGIVQLPTVAVTGSNIEGTATEKSLPVTVMSAQDIVTAGIGTMAELVESLPYSTNVFINETATGPNDARGDVSTINLRNLGASRTLVLLNGRRLSAYGVTPGTPPVQFVNVNAIPFAAIEQVEVLRDGASAVYGSDAIGGVVNTRLRRAYDGFQTQARYSDGGSGAREYSLGLAGGRAFNAGRSRVALFASHYEREILMATERAFARNADKRPLVGAPFDANFNFSNLNSSSPFGRFTAVTDAGTGVSVPGVTSASGQFHFHPDTGARTAGAGPTFFYNSQLATQLLPAITRRNLFATFDHDFNPAVALFSEFSYYDAHAFGQFDATPVSLTTDGIIIPKTNYYNPVGTRFFGPGTANPAGTPRNVAIRNFRLSEVGPRSYDTDAISRRLLAGLRGSLPGTTWTWEGAAMYMNGRTRQVNHGYVSQTRFLQQLGLDTPAAYNPFAPPAGSPPEISRNFVIDIWDDGVGTLTAFDGKASGDVYALPGGPVVLAVGGEFRREGMQQRNDPFGLADDVVAQSEQLDIAARRDVYAAFAEVLFPLVGDANRRPGIQALDVRVAGRHEDYSRFSALKPGASLAWRPAANLLLRASYNEGFRAPAVVELFTPAIGRRNEGFADPARPGQPDAATGISKRVVTGGNRDLRPEESESYNLGFVFDVPRLAGFSVGADFFRIRQFNQIDDSTPADELTLDAQLWAAGNGSNPRVRRQPQTAADLAANIPGVLIEVLGTYQNLSLREIQGVDTFINYRSPRWPAGQFNVTAAVTYTDRLRTIDERGNHAELVRNNGNPRRKATAGVSWSRDSWSASVQQRYTSDYLAPAEFTTGGVPFVVDDYWVTNASIGYSFRRQDAQGLRVRLGMNNLFDEQPPLYPANSSGYDPSYADARGRMPFVDVSYRF